MPFLDGHTHLDHSEELVAEQVAHARAAGLDILIQSGTDLASSRHALSLAAAYPEVFATVGIHPHDAAEASPADVPALGALAADPKVVAIGEIGLDFYRNRSPRDVQEAVFVEQIRLARNVGLPIVIHTRDADRRSLPLLREHAAGLTVVLHCFSLPERLQEFVEWGWFMSFAGNLTYKKSSGLREVVRRVPAELLLVETDAPYLTPEPRRGRPNEPALVVLTYQAIARERGVPVEELARTVRDNAFRAYPRLAAWFGPGAGEAQERA